MRTTRTETPSDWAMPLSLATRPLGSLTWTSTWSPTRDGRPDFRFFPIYGQDSIRIKRTYQGNKRVALLLLLR